MANQQHLDILKQGKDALHQWKRKFPGISLDFSEIDLHGYQTFFKGGDFSKAIFRKTNLSKTNFSEADLSEADLEGADLDGANLSNSNLWGANLTMSDLRYARLIKADLRECNLSGADLSGAHLDGANLSKLDLRKTKLSGATLNGANLSQVNLSGADLRGAHLFQVDLRGAILKGADLSRTTIVNTNLRRADLTNCKVYGISVWNVELEESKEVNLVITSPNEPIITVDNLKMAQFIYLLLNNKGIRDIIDSITYKVVLILGRFIPERKAVLDTIKDELRQKNYVSVLFDFEKPASRDFTETVTILAHLARFIIVDLTDPSSAPHEMATVIPQTVVPVQPLLTLQPLIVEGKEIKRHEYALFEDLRRRYHWVLPTFRYQNTAELLASLKEHIIEPAEQKALELEKR